MDKKDRIYQRLQERETQIQEQISKLEKKVSVTAYCDLVRYENGAEIWSDAMEKALSDGEIIIIPYRDTPYYLDKTLVLPSGTRIVAEDGAIIRRADGFRFIMLRNEQNTDGSFYREESGNRDCNISVEGGIWDGACSEYCHTPYDADGNFSGANATMFFNHLDNLSVKNVTIRNSGEFSIQAGDLCGAIFEHIRFEHCYADGIHLNGNSEQVIVRDVKGQVGDDLVALNAFDWERSSVNFGKISDVLCENLELSADSGYKAIRILPGKYTYQDNQVSDCRIENVIIKKVRGINTFKTYFQRERHRIGEIPTYGAPGCINNMFFEDIEAVITEPIDKLSAYLENNPVNGQFAVFELGSDIGMMCFENIRITMDKEKNPMSFLLTIGAKSIRLGEWEFFDPQIGARAEKLILKEIYINGEKMADAQAYICPVVFDDIYGDGNSSSVGEIKELVIE